MKNYLKSFIFIARYYNKLKIKKYIWLKKNHINK